MKGVAVAVLLLLVKPNTSGGYAIPAKRSVLEQSNSVVTSSNSLGIPDDDPDMQSSLRKVMKYVDQKLNRTPFEEDGMRSTQKLKLFFVSPSPDDSSTGRSYEVPDRGIPFTQAGDGDFENTVVPINQIRELEYYRNNTGSSLHNDSRVNDKVDMKVELTINLSENDHQHYFRSENHTGISKNISDHIHVEETKPVIITPQQRPKDNDSVLKIAAGNLNLDIKLTSPNHTDKGTLKQQGSSRSLNSEMPEDSLHKTHKAKKNVDNNEYAMMEHNVNDTNRIDKSDAGRDNNSHVEQDVTTETNSAKNGPSTTESTPMQQDGNGTENLLSDSLKAIIRNLTKYYANQENGGHAPDGENLIRNLSKFLPSNGGTLQEQNYLNQLRKYLSQPNLFDKIHFPKLDTSTDFETFMQVLKKLSKSKNMKESGYYPIISEYVNLYDILNPGADSNDNSSSEEESYESSLVESLLDYLFDNDTGHKHKSQSDESESDEWDVL